jgi:F-box domain
MSDTKEEIVTSNTSKSTIFAPYMPDDLLRHIYAFVPIKNRATLGMTCKTLFRGYCVDQKPVPYLASLVSSTDSSHGATNRLIKAFQKAHDLFKHVEVKKWATQTIPGKRVRNYDIDMEDLQFQVYCKYSANGYESPEQFLEQEPEIAKQLDEYESGRHTCTYTEETHKVCTKTIEAIRQWCYLVVDMMEEVSDTGVATHRDMVKLNGFMRRALHNITKAHEHMGAFHISIETFGRKRKHSRGPASQRVRVEPSTKQ